MWCRVEARIFQGINADQIHPATTELASPSVWHSCRCRSGPAPVHMQAEDLDGLLCLCNMVPIMSGLCHGICCGAGFKSVAHYLVLTKQALQSQELAAEDKAAAHPVAPPDARGEEPASGACNGEPAASPARQAIGDSRPAGLIQLRIDEAMAQAKLSGLLQSKKKASKRSIAVVPRGLGHCLRSTSTAAAQSFCNTAGGALSTGLRGRQDSRLSNIGGKGHIGKESRALKTLLIKPRKSGRLMLLI